MKNTGAAYSGRPKSTAVSRGWLLTLLFVVGLSGMCAAAPYVSLKGQFSVDFPDDWAQVDYVTVDYFLRAMGADASAFNYDAVFAVNKPGQFHENEYVIITLEPVGQLSRRQQDSVVSELSGATPKWDRGNSLVTITDKDDTSPKSNFFALKFYDKGIAQFYFFTPDSTFDRYLPVFQGIVNSFSTENIGSKLPREEVKLADPNKIKEAAKAGPEDDSSGNTLLPFGVSGGGLFIIILLIIIARRKRRSRKSDEKGSL